MAKWPKISVVTPSYNQARFLGLTIESVLDQKYPNLEYLVFDGGSTDDSLKILKQFGNHIQWVSQPDRGQTDAINQGLKQATGEIVCYLNSDDLLVPGALKTVAEAFRHHPAAVWLTGRGRIINETNQPIRSAIVAYKNLWLSHYSRSGLLITNFICQPATFWQRRFHDQIGYLEESLRYVMDYDFWLRLSQISDPIVVPEILASFRIHAASKGESQFEKQFTEDLAVLQRSTTAVIPRLLHRLHNGLIVASYRLIK